MDKKYIVGGALLAAGVGYIQYRDFLLFRDSLGFAIKNVEFDATTTTQNQIGLKFNIVLNNPRNYRVTAQSFLLDLGFNSRIIGRAIIVKPFEIKPNSITTIPARFTIPYNSAIPAITQLFTLFLQDFTIPLQAGCIIRFGLFDAKFSTNFNLL